MRVKRFQGKAPTRFVGGISPPRTDGFEQKSKSRKGREALASCRLGGVTSNCAQALAAIVAANASRKPGSAWRRYFCPRRSHPCKSPRATLMLARRRARCWHVAERIAIGALSCLHGSPRMPQTSNRREKMLRRKVRQLDTKPTASSGACLDVPQPNLALPIFIAYSGEGSAIMCHGDHVLVRARDVQVAEASQLAERGQRSMQAQQRRSDCWVQRLRRVRVCDALDPPG